ncbi:hypothetical protein [Pelagivirga sediminicola]|uniref:hypothetical protein n=1 Tax=Pelagivirga sediminicola TaxID=2170575 RepID=UPI0034E0CD52
MFNALIEDAGLDSLMVPVTCRPENFDIFWAGLSAMENLKGMIISVPFKQRVSEKCATAHSRAARAGAANTVVRRADGQWHADNFDGVGFMDGLAAAGRAVHRDRLGRSILPAHLREHYAPSPRRGRSISGHWRELRARPRSLRPG